MNRRLSCRHALTLSLALTLLVACQSPRAGISQEEASPVSSLEQSKPKHNVRQLRKTLPGASMGQVVRILGQPTRVATFEGTEIWDYRDAVFDSVTGRVVRYLSISFVNRAVKRVNFSY
jgi:outer membrane protein assembly factor BamE (lipoprotein component of BamABCDE complex)